MIEPQGLLKLLNVPITLDNRNQLTFKDSETQFKYFSSKVVHNLMESSYNYIRENDSIVVSKTIDSLYNCNYLMYQNKGFTNKWFYAFILKIEYVNPNATRIYYSTDEYQTWQFQFEMKPSFVVREHVSDDTIGKHTQAENLETGEYVCDSRVTLFDEGNDCYIGISSTYFPDTIQWNMNIAEYGGIYSGASILIMESPLAATNFIKGMDELAKKDAITGIFMIPKALCGTLEFKIYPVGEQSVFCSIPNYTKQETILKNSQPVDIPGNLNGYVPKNNKLFTYPFNYFYISNNIGSNVEFRYEDFVNNQPSFRTIGTITPGCSIKCFPLNYKKLADVDNSNYSYIYGITGAKYPVCSWSSDMYTNWLTENGVNMAFQGLGSLASIGAGVGMVASGGGAVAGAGMIAAGVTGIANQLMSVRQHSLVPEQMNGSSTGDITFSTKKMDIPAYKMTLRYENAKIIDDYFTMFGYKVNALKVPEFNSRPNWNYVQTIDCNILANIPQESIAELKRIFNTGVTLWHNPDTFGDYSQNNKI